MSAGLGLDKKHQCPFPGRFGECTIDGLTVPLIDFQQTMRLQIKMRYRLVKFALPWPR